MIFKGQLHIWNFFMKEAAIFQKFLYFFREKNESVRRIVIECTLEWLNEATQYLSPTNLPRAHSLPSRQENFKDRHTSFYCVSLSPAAQIMCFVLFFTNWRFVATLLWASLLPTNFQKHFQSLCHIWWFSQYLKCSLSLSLWRWSAITDLWCYYCQCFGCHDPCPHKMADFIYSVSRLYLLHQPAAPPSLCLSISVSQSLGLPVLWDTVILNRAYK